MGFKSDIEIAQECEMKPITEIAAKAGIADKYLEQYGIITRTNRLQSSERNR